MPLPLLALPLILGASNSALMVGMDACSAAKHAWDGNIGGFSNLFDGIKGGKNDTFIGCVSEAVVHGVMSVPKAFTAPIRSAYNGVRALGELAHGDYSDAAMHGIAALTGFDSIRRIVDKLPSARSWNEAGAIVKVGVRHMPADKSASILGRFYGSYVDPWIVRFQGARTNKGCNSLDLI
jgi:hypothetical protein